MQTYTRAHIHTHTHTHTHTHRCAHARIHDRAHTGAHTRARANTHTYTHARTHALIHTRGHVMAFMPVRISSRYPPTAYSMCMREHALCALYSSHGPHLLRYELTIRRHIPPSITPRATPTPTAIRTPGSEVHVQKEQLLIAFTSIALSFHSLHNEAHT